MGKQIVRYLWLDGHASAGIRTKERVFYGNVDEESLRWSFDGSSTEQATGYNSDVDLMPVRLYEKYGENIVICECWKNGEPLSTDGRAQLRDTIENDKLGIAIGFEQEFGLVDADNGEPIGLSERPEQGRYYCSVGARWDLSNGLLSDCILDNKWRAKDKRYDLGPFDHAEVTDVYVCGFNTEVMPGQFEVQVGPTPGRPIPTVLRVCDDLILVRYLLMSTTNRDYQGTKNVGISFNPKLDHHYNGAGLHTNISTTITREKNTDGTIFMRTVNELISKLSDGHKDIRSKPHCYGIGIEKRLTGHNETASIEVFSSGVADRGASVRIPQPCVNKAQGYFEDRRPCANANPYLVAEHVVKHLNN